MFRIGTFFLVLFSLLFGSVGYAQQRATAAQVDQLIRYKSYMPSWLEMPAFMNVMRKVYYQQPISQEDKLRCRDEYNNFHAHYEQVSREKWKYSVLSYEWKLWSAKDQEISSFHAYYMGLVGRWFRLNSAGYY